MEIPGLRSAETFQFSPYKLVTLYDYMKTYKRCISKPDVFQSNFGLSCSFKENVLSFQNEALQLCIKINTAIDRVDYMFTSEFEAEVEETEKATLQLYYREAMIQGYNFAFEV